MTLSCIVCDSVEYENLYPAIVKCKKCGYIYADLDLSQKDYEQLYNSRYFNGEEYSDYISDKVILQKNFIARLTTLKTIIDPNVHKSLLEVGSAYGFFLDVAKKDFLEVTGVDVSEDGVNYSRDKLKLDAYVADLLTWDFNNKYYDVVCMWDTIEHLKSPQLYIKKISKNMSPGSMLAITTGDISSFVARWRKHKWRLIHPPTHAHYFSKDSLTRLLDKYGFDVIYVEYSGFYRSIDNIAYTLFVLRSKNRWLYKMLTWCWITRLNLYSNLFDIMYIIARKR